ncbi:MAG TPA: hypothetical protein VHW66_03835 [Stellaceae bacterium]|jgi:hypothetical protein|nr:hypothetical protein [Stellaceae bacterium]
MKYPNGQPVSVGDRVELWGDRQGIVVCSIDSGEFTADYPKSEWGYLGSGVVIRTDAGDVFHYKGPDEDFKLIGSRAATRDHVKAGD